MRNDEYMTNIWPEETCPQCGKVFLRRRDWGCVVDSRQTGQSSQRAVTKLCSIPCMRAYEREQLERSARHAETLRCVQSYRLVRMKGLTPTDVQRILGHPKTAYVQNDIQFAENNYWKEIDWLEEHGWTVEKGA